MMKTWLITGCSSGLGRSIAKACLDKGYNVAVTARNKETLNEFKVKFPQNALILELDVTKEASIKQAVSTTLSHFGTIDGLINNAGYGYRSAVEEGSIEDTRKLFDTNFWGAVELMKEVLPIMREKREGAIINISSIAALSTSPGSGYYAASKCALEGLSDGLRAETEGLGIKVMVVEPGAFRTNFAGRSLTQSKVVIEDYASTAGKRRIENDRTHGTQPGDPDKAAKLILEAIESEHPPFRLLLGSDALDYANKVMARRKAETDSWQSFSIQSDFDKR